MNIFLSNLIFSLSEILKSRKINHKIRYLDDYYKLSYQVRKIQNKKNLINIIDFAINNVPYYIDVSKKINFDIRKFKKDIRYLDDFPFLTKNIIREQHTRLLAKNHKKIKKMVSKTGGSTGPSCNIYYDNSARDFSSAVTFFCRGKVTNSFLPSNLHISSNLAPTDNFIEKNKEFTEKLKNFVLNRHDFKYKSLNDSTYYNLYSLLLKYKFKIIHSHPSIMYAFINYLKKNELSIKNNFDLFEPSGEVLESYMQKKITRNTNCQIKNRYGLAEFGIVAYQLYDSAFDKLFLLDSEVYPENIDQEIVFSGLRNYLMPLIRYKTGDLGTLKENKQKGFYLSKLKGRVHDIFSVGAKIYFTGYIMDILDHKIGNIKEFQIDLRKSKAQLKIIPEPEVNINDQREKIKHYFKNDFNVVYCDFSDLIRVGNQNKFRHLIT